MHHVEPADILRYDLFQGEFNRQLVTDVLQWLTPKNIHIALVSSLLANDPTFETKVVPHTFNWLSCCVFVRSS